LNQLMFSAKTNEGQTATNDYLHYLNQSWRLKAYEEAILVGTLRDEYGDATTLNQGGILGTRIKLTNPAGNDLVNGTLRQATFLRVYLPLRAAEGQPQ